MSTTFHVCISPVGWHDTLAISAYAQPHHDSRAHRSLRTANACDTRIQRGCARCNGANTWIPTRILASEDRGVSFRALTESESEELVHENFRAEVGHHYSR